MGACGMSGTRSTVREGWGAAPVWVRAALVGFSAVSVIALVGLVLAGLFAPLVGAVAVALALLVIYALAGTVLDVFVGDEVERRQKARSLAIGITLVVLVVLFFAATIVRLGGNVFNRPL